MKTPKPKMTRYTVNDFRRQFSTDAACLEWLCNYIYPDGIHCATCERVTKHHRVKSRPSYSCDYCGHHVHPTAGTIFHKSPTPLTTWFYAIYLMASTRCGISAKQIERETGVTYKTAWRMFRQIRSMLTEGDAIGGVGKRVEMDETGVGGFTKRLRKPAPDKVTVFGAVERKGRVRAVVAPDRKQDTLLPLVRQFVLPQSIIFTDEFASYDTLRYRGGYSHRRINHSAGVYVLGLNHTQTIEGFWSLIKRGIGGVYHAVSKKYLQTYLDEYSFRYNRRFDTQPMFTSFLHQIHKLPLPLEDARDRRRDEAAADAGF